MGSDAALQIPAGKVAYALPVSRYSGVAWALQAGDHVDVIISLLMTDLDEEFQTALPDNAACVQPAEGEECQGGVMGRLQVLANGWIVNLTPSEAQRPRLVTQMTVRDAIVLYIGDWSSEGVAAAPEEEAQAVEVQPAEGATATPTPTRAAVEPLTIIVTPQDAMVLKYAEEVGASIDLVLRSAGDTNQVPTESVTLQYLLDRFDIELPPKLPYGVTPPIYSLPSAESVAGGTTGQATEQ
jgi:Flp pilus assembly protein CpaB